MEYFGSYAVIGALAWGLVGAVGASLEASSKGRSAGAWALAGLLLGPIAILIVGFMTPQLDTLEGSRKCPYCAELIAVEASVCHGCGRPHSRPLRG